MNDIPEVGKSSMTVSSHSQGFPFSAFFQPSEDSSPGISALHTAPRPNGSILREQASSFFIGFSWGPVDNAFLKSTSPLQDSLHLSAPRETSSTPRSAHMSHITPTLFQALPSSTPFRYPFTTPLRPSSFTALATLPRTSTVRRSAPRRAVSDREAMRQLVDCIGLSARKKVLAAGRTPRTFAGPATVGPRAGKALRFVPAPLDIDTQPIPQGMAAGEHWDGGGSGESESDAPPSPSPSPRPGSAMSMLSRRSVTPTVTGSWSLSLRLPSNASLSGMRRHSSSPAVITRARSGSASEISGLEFELENGSRLSVNSSGMDDSLAEGIATPDAALVELEHRYECLMGEITGLEDRIGVARRRAHSLMA